MPVVSGILKVGEANGAVRAVARRQRGSTYIYYFLMFGLMIAGAALGYGIASLLMPSKSGAGLGIGIFAGLIAYTVFGKKIVLLRFRQELANRAIPLNLLLSMEVTPDALLYKVGEVEQKAKWAAVTEIFRSSGYWIFLVQASPWYAPEHFFVSREEEKALLQAALDCMSDEATQRSPNALAFVEA